MSINNYTPPRQFHYYSPMRISSCNFLYWFNLLSRC